MAAAGGPDLLFGLRNNFYLGAYQAAINNSEIPNLSADDVVEKDSLVYRSYIALGSYQVRLDTASLRGSTLDVCIARAKFCSWSDLEFVLILLSRDFSSISCWFLFLFWCVARDKWDWFIGGNTTSGGEIIGSISLQPWQQQGYLLCFRSLDCSRCVVGLVFQHWIYACNFTDFFFSFLLFF